MGMVYFFTFDSISHAWNRSKGGGWGGVFWRRLARARRVSLSNDQHVSDVEKNAGTNKKKL